MFYKELRFAEHLSHRENWTPMMVYIHRSRLVGGVVVGFVLGVVVSVTVRVATL